MPLSPKVTVYVVSHNYGGYVEKAIESVFDQTFDDWELLLIDDGSTDHTSNVMKCYENHPKVRFFRTEGIGLTAVCNFALSKAKGEYLIRLDGDDFFDVNILLVQANHMEKDSSLALVFPDYYLIDENAEIFAHERRRQLYSEDHIMDAPPNGACTMFRTASLREVGGYREDLGAQDGFDIWMKLKDKYKCANINLPLFFYRRHGKNLTEEPMRIVNARRTLKKEQANKLLQNERPVLAVIPCRKHFDFVEDVWNLKLDGITLLEKDIHTCLESDLIEKVIITCDNLEAKDLVHSFNNPKVVFHHRGTKSTQRSANLALTMADILKKYDPQHKGISIIRYTQTPFISKDTLEEAISSLLISDADSACTIEEVSDTIYMRSAHGLIRVNGESTKMIGKETLFRDTSTCLAVQNSNIKSGSLRGTRMTGFSISAAEGFFINSEFTLETARNISKKPLAP